MSSSSMVKHPFCILFLLAVSIGFSPGGGAAGPVTDTPQGLLEEVRKAHALYVENSREGRPGSAFDAYVGSLSRAARVLRGGPDAAEVYFLLGEAYARAGFLPEARSHLHIVVADYPKSEWATSALILLKEIEDPRRFDETCEGCIRQYPDTTLALSAWIFLAHNALEEGKGEAIAEEVARLEAVRPDMDVVQPLLQDLKARLAVLRKDEDAARDLWLRLANLSTSPKGRASALFEVAESLARSSRPFDARKYYSLIRFHHADTPEALFSAMRLAQMARAERASLGAIAGSFPGDAQTGEETFRRILSSYPHHPLAAEAAVELMRILLGQGRLQEFAERAEALARNRPKDTVAGEALGLVREACDLLSRSQTPRDLFADPADVGRRILPSPPEGPLGEETVRLVRIAWLRGIEATVVSGNGLGAAREACEFSRLAPGSPESDQAAAVSRRALVSRAETLLRDGKPLQILNESASLASDGCPVSPEYRGMVGEAWHEIGCDHAALREFYAAWTEGIGQDASASFLRDWADTALDAGDHETAEVVLRLYRGLPEGSRKAAPDIRVPEIRLAVIRGEGALARDLLGEILAGGEKDMGRDDRMRLFEAAVRLGQWPAVRTLWKGIEAGCDGKERARLLLLWGDEALGRKQPDVALEAYESIPDEAVSPPVLVRRSIVKDRLGLSGPALEDLELLSASGDPLLAEAAKILANTDRLIASLGRGPSGNGQGNATGPMGMGR